MFKELGVFEYLSATVASLVTFLFGNYDLPLQCVILLMIVDYVSGNVRAWINNEVSSSRGKKGIVTKSSYFLVILVANILDILTGVEITRIAVCYMIIGTEIWSILENAGAMGAPIPPILYDKLEQIKSFVPTEDEKGE